MGESLRQGANDRKMKTGVAGCGRMGLPMAKSLARAGIDTVGFDIRRGNDFGGLPMEFAPDRFAHDLTVLFSVVRDEAQTEALLFDDQKVLSEAKALEYLVICSTVSPSFIHDVRRRLPDHIELVDAPMSGAAIAAEEARLSFMVGGSPDVTEELMLHFSAMGETFHLFDSLGAGMTAKVLNNLVAAAATAATRTALAWGEHNNLAREQLLAVLQTSSGQTWFGSNFDKIEFSKEGYLDDNSIGLLVKDVTAAFSAAPNGASPELTDALIETIRKLEPLSP